MEEKCPVHRLIITNRNIMKRPLMEAITANSNRAMLRSNHLLPYLTPQIVHISISNSLGSYLWALACVGDFQSRLELWSINAIGPSKKVRRNINKQTNNHPIPTDQTSPSSPPPLPTLHYIPSPTPPLRLRLRYQSLHLYKHLTSPP
jgi:HAMP domain-containing protein